MHSELNLRPMPDIPKKELSEGRKRSLANLQPPWKAGDDPRRNMKGRPKVLPLQKILMQELLGYVKDEQDMSESEIALVVSALVKQAKGKGPASVAAAKEILERAFGKVKDSLEVKAQVGITWNETKTYKNGK